MDAISTHYRDAQDTIDTLTSTATKLEVWRPVNLSAHLFYLVKNSICAIAIITLISQRDQFSFSQNLLLALLNDPS